jgi:hypothetical protein
MNLTLQTRLRENIIVLNTIHQLRKTPASNKQMKKMGLYTGQTHEDKGDTRNNRLRGRTLEPA